MPTPTGRLEGGNALVRRPDGLCTRWASSGLTPSSCPPRPRRPRARPRRGPGHQALALYAHSSMNRDGMRFFRLFRPFPFRGPPLARHWPAMGPPWACRGPAMGTDVFLFDLGDQHRGHPAPAVCVSVCLCHPPPSVRLSRTVPHASPPRAAAPDVVLLSESLAADVAGSSAEMNRVGARPCRCHAAAAA